MVSGWLSRRGQVLSRAGIGVLTYVAAPDLVDEAVGDGLAWEMRLRALPARLGVYFVLGLCLFSGADSVGPPGYRSVMRWLTNGLRHLDGVVLPTSSALTRARQRLGARPLELLSGLRRGPLAAAGTPGAFAFGALWPPRSSASSGRTPAGAGT